MELKVWADGIQRVVCGVSCATTCQDVVLALASAMGRAGRFSLVEKWRRCERYLIPTECPLQSLLKWGEYAGEVRYYLFQARTDSAGQQMSNTHRSNTPGHKMHAFLCSSTLLEASQHNRYPSGSDVIKRSSTFSGAHKSMYESLPPSSPQSATSVAPSQHSFSQQKTIPPSLISTAREHQSGFAPAHDGKPAGLSPVSFSKSSQRSFSTTVIPENCLSMGALAEPHTIPSVTLKSDARKLHPANMPKALSSNSSHIEEYSPSFPHRNFQPTQPKSSSQQMISKQKTQLPNQEQLQHPLTSSSKPSYPSSSVSHLSAAPAKSQQSYQSQQQHLPPSSHLPHQQPQPIPSPRHHTVATSPTSDQEAIPTDIKSSPHLRNTSSSQNSPACTPYSGCTRNFFNKGSDGNIESKAGTNTFSHSMSSQDGTVLNHNQNSVSEATRQYQCVPTCLVPQTLGISDKNIKKQPQSKDLKESPVASKPDVVKFATLDRHFTRSRPSPGLPSRSLSTDGGADEHKRSDERQVSRLQTSSDRAQLQPGIEGNKLCFVGSSMMKQQRSDAHDISNRRVSSFASAVAHLQQLSGDALLIQSKPSTHIRQHSSDSWQNDASFKGRHDPSSNTFSMQRQHSLRNSSSDFTTYSNNQQYENNPGQQLSNKTRLSETSPSSQHNFSLTEVSKVLNHQESSPTSVANSTYNVDDKQGSNTLYNPSSFPSKDIDVVDKNRTGVPGNGSAVINQQPITQLEYNKSVEVIPSQTKEDYSQLLRMFRLQQEKIKVQEAQITDVSQEITAIEDKALRSQSGLEAVVEEASRFERQEAIYKLELDSLDMSEWTSVEEREKTLETEITLHITSLRVKLEAVESQILHLKEEECKISSELTTEEEKCTLERTKKEELEEKTILEIKLLEDQLSRLNIITEEYNQKLEDVERKIHQADTHLNQKEEQVKCMEEELNNESDKPSHIPEDSITPALAATDTAFPISESGEAILKILEERLSSQSSPTSFTREEFDNLGGVFSAQHLYTSAMTVNNQNGVWV